jgi:uncharacterized protein YfdQ (DUF2303 family)
LSENVAETASRLAHQTKPVHELEPGKIIALLDDEGGFRIVDTLAYGDTPALAQGSSQATSVDSLVAYLARHGSDKTELWADASTSELVAVLDAHEGADGKPGWGKHRISLKLAHTPAWNAWLALDGKQVDQLKFAEFIEDHVPDIAEPSPAAMLEIAQTLIATNKVDFKSGAKIANGEVQFSYVEAVEGSAGKNGDMAIPTEFFVVLRPYFGGPPYRIRARFRYRISGGGLTLAYKLDNPELVLESAFADVVTILRQGRPADEAKGVAALEPVKGAVYDGRPRSA